MEILDFDLRSTLEDMGDLLAIKAEEKGLEYLCMVDPDVPSFLRGDPGRLRQVLTNLIGNAIKFTSRGEVALQVTVDHRDDGEITLRFAVSDTGIGIPRDKRTSLFQPFTQVDASTTRRYGGTGLGLSISKALVEMMGGQIGLDSEEGIGSTFWFTSVLRKQPRAEEKPDKEIAGLGTKRILVVDDNRTNRKVLAGQLNFYHLRWDEAEAPETAFQKLREAASRGDPFHIALLDMQMPGMDGATLGEQIKNDSNLRDTTLVMMTSIGRRGDASRLEKIGFSAYLTKPVKQSQLYDCLVMISIRKSSTSEESERPIVTRHTISEAGRRNTRILLAEDNAINQKIALKLIENLGYQADAVVNGAEAIHALEKTAYDLVLMDVQMPEMDGLEATRHIRNPQSKIRHRNIPIIAMTAHALKGDRERCLKAGMDDYISKPFQPEEFAETIGRWVHHKTLSDPAPKEMPVSLSKNSFDRSDLLHRLRGDEELLKEIVRVFVEDIPDQIESLKEGLRKGDASKVHHQAHTLKGASGNAGAPVLQDLALQLETSAKAGDLARGAILIEQIENEFEELKQIFAGDNALA